MTFSSLSIDRNHIKIQWTVLTVHFFYVSVLCVTDIIILIFLTSGVKLKGRFYIYDLNKH